MNATDRDRLLAEARARRDDAVARAKRKREKMAWALRARRSNIAWSWNRREVPNDPDIALNEINKAYDEYKAKAQAADEVAQLAEKEIAQLKRQAEFDAWFNEPPDFTSKAQPQ